MEEKKINSKIVFSVVAVLLLIAVVAGATYAYFSATASSDTQTITTGKLTLGFTSGNIVRATNIVPIEDSEITTEATELEFSVTNSGTQMMKIEVLLEDISISEELKDLDFRWGLYNKDTGNAVSRGVFKDIGTATTMTLLQDTLVDPTETKNYILRVYIHNDGAEQNSMQGKSFSAKVTVNGDGVDYTPEDCFTIEDLYGDGEYAIIGYDDSCPLDVVVPETINGQTVTKVDYIPQTLNSLVLSDNITSVGKVNIDGNLTLPETCTYGYAGADYEGAYENDDSDGSVKTVTIADGVRNLGPLIITDMETIVYPSSLLWFQPLDWGPLTDSVIMDGGETISSTVFFGDTIEVPASITTLGSMHFSGIYTFRDSITFVVRKTEAEAKSLFDKNWNCKEYDGDLEWDENENVINDCLEYYPTYYRP